MGWQRGTPWTILETRSLEMEVMAPINNLDLLYNSNGPEILLCSIQK